MLASLRTERFGFKIAFQLLENIVLGRKIELRHIPRTRSAPAQLHT